MRLNLLCVWLAATACAHCLFRSPAACFCARLLFVRRVQCNVVEPRVEKLQTRRQKRAHAHTHTRSQRKHSLGVVAVVFLVSVLSSDEAAAAVCCCRRRRLRASAQDEREPSTLLQLLFCFYFERATTTASIAPLASGSAIGREQQSVRHSRQHSLLHSLLSLRRQCATAAALRHFCCPRCSRSRHCYCAQLTRVEAAATN